MPQHVSLFFRLLCLLLHYSYCFDLPFCICRDSKMSFFFLGRDHHQQSLINDVLSIMTHILNEEVSHQLMDVILGNLIQESKVSVGRLLFFGSSKTVFNLCTRTLSQKGVYALLEEAI